MLMNQIFWVGQFFHVKKSFKTLWFFEKTKKMAPFTLVCDAVLLRNLAFFEPNLSFYL